MGKLNAYDTLNAALDINAPRAFLYEPPKKDVTARESMSRKVLEGIEHVCTQYIKDDINLDGANLAIDVLYKATRPFVTLDVAEIMDNTVSTWQKLTADHKSVNEIQTSDVAW